MSAFARICNHHRFAIETFQANSVLSQHLLLLFVMVVVVVVVGGSVSLGGGLVSDLFIAPFLLSLILILTHARTAPSCPVFIPPKVVGTNRYFESVPIGSEGEKCRIYLCFLFIEKTTPPRAPVGNRETLTLAFALYCAELCCSVR